MKTKCKISKTLLQIALFVLLPVSLYSCADNTKIKSYSIYDVAEEIIDWDNFEFKDVCTFKIPQSMEVRQNVNLSLIVNNMTTMATMLCADCDPYQSDTKIVLQPAGIDAVTKGEDFNSNPFSSYSRIMIDLHESAGINKDNVLLLTDEDLNYIENDLMKTQRNFFNCMSDYTKQRGEFKWEYLRVAMVNDQPCLECSFIRPGVKGPVKVTAFAIYLNDDNMAEVICSYHLGDSNLYKKDVENFIYTLRFDDKYLQKKAKQTASNNNTFTSNVNHLSYSYNDDYESVPIKNAPHMLLNLNYKSSKIMRSFTISSWNCDYEDGLFDSDIVENFRKKDSGLGVVINACAGEYIYIPNKTYCLISTIKGSDSGITMYSTAIRIIHKDKLICLVFFQDENDYKTNPNEYKNVLKGLDLQ